MASHRKPRPGGTQAAGLPAPALATAALTSVAVLAQPADAPPVPGHMRPTAEEVERKIEDLYRHAESAAEAMTSGTGRERTGRGELAGRGERTRSGERTGRGETGRGERAGREPVGRGELVGPGAPVWPEEPVRLGEPMGRRGESVGRAQWAWAAGRADGVESAGLAEGGEWPAGRAQRTGPPEPTGRTERAGTAERTAWAAWEGRVNGAGPTRPTEPAGIPPGQADSLQRLREEVARRARHRSIPALRALTAQHGTVPAQHATSQPGSGTVPAQRGTAQPGYGTVPAQRGTAQPGYGSSQPGSGTVPAQHATSQPGSGTVPAQRGTAQPGYGSSQPGSGTVPAQRGTGQPGYGTGQPGNGVRQPARGTDQPRHGTDQPASGTGQPGHSTGRPAGNVGLTTPPRPDPAATAPTRGAATPPATRYTAHPRPADDQGAAVSAGPRAAKAAVRKKLALARVLLSQRSAPAAATPSGAYPTKASKALAFARAQLGKPCVWGAAGPGSYDCAGLTRAAWKSAGVTLPRTAAEQAGVGTPVPPAEARPGDLVFFHDDAGHVGLCTGDGMVIHAPRPGAYVREEPVSALGETAVHSVVRPG
ncbi:NlpC/P60 family protein [Streptomyces sp. NPDC017248]|uniref:NlpC/P60 family protein n=1 Tax=unclassified Streptomyces TaxID=2593676 RepID=UPI0037A3DFA7